MIKRLFDAIWGLDIFGHPITVFYKGEDTYKTKLGTLCTLMVWTLTFMFLQQSLASLLDMEDPDIIIL